MDEFFDQFFPTEFLIEYLENGPEENMDRFQKYVVFRFLLPLQRKILRL